MKGTERDHWVHAAGCLVWRPHRVSGKVELAVVFRPRRNDWSWPKGKLETGETSYAAAMRETFEETGLNCRMGVELPTVRYTDAKGRPKEVRYWAAEATGGSFRPNQEVSRLLWLRPEDADRQLTYQHDRGLIPHLLGALGMRT